MPHALTQAQLKRFDLSDLNRMYNEAARTNNLSLMANIMAEFRRREQEAERLRTKKGK